MTDASLRANIAAEAERGDDALNAAAKLLEASLPYDAASRAYYAAFHYARALCLAAGEEPRSHQGVAHLVSLHYVRAGIFPPETSRGYATLQRFRESSDYDAAFVLDERGAIDAVEKARAFVELARRHLEAEGLLNPRQP
jgi:uncharacterized protein (UPF0332 family)